MTATDPIKGQRPPKLLDQLRRDRHRNATNPCPARAAEDDPDRQPIPSNGFSGFRQGKTHDPLSAAPGA